MSNVRDDALAVKRALEDAMRSESDDDAVRTLYFQQLARLARSHIGLCEAWLPELRYPLLFRCGSADVDMLTRIFLDREHDWLADGSVPARILDLAAGPGYAAVFLANRFPDAQILCLEPVPANFRLLLLNTMAYRNTAHLNAAAWSHTGRLRVTAVHGARREYQLADAAEGDQGTYRCFSVGEILRMRAWDRADFVRCEIASGGAALFAGPDEWVALVDTVAVTRHNATVPDDDHVSGCFDPAQFTRVSYGATEVYRRHPMEPAVPKPRLIPLIHSAPGLSPLEVRHVAAEDRGFFLFDDRGCQLHPNAPGEPPAQTVFTVDCNGQNRFTTIIMHVGQAAEDVIFRVVIRRLADGLVLMDSARRVLAGAGAEWSEWIPVLRGPHEIVLETEMAPGASTNANARARWIDPRLG